MPKVITSLKVFLSSPGDLNKERSLFGEIIANANKVLAQSDSDIRLELVKWETDTAPSLGKDAQSVVNEQIGDNYDIFVGLMWTRFGTSTPRAGSGTEEEFNLAYKKLKTNPDSIRILFYFKDSSPKSLGQIDPKQFEKVEDFKAQIKREGLVCYYDSVKEFKELTRKHLIKHAKDFRKGWGFSSIDQHDLQLDPTEHEEPLFPKIHRIVRDRKNSEIKVIPSKKVYARLNADEIGEWLDEFTVRYPIITGVISESILYKIKQIFDYEKVFDVSISEAIAGEWWLSDLDYSVLFLKKPFLNIMLYMESIGAYPWSVTRSIVVDYETGTLVKIKDVFREGSLERLASIINEFAQQDMKMAFLKFKYLDEIPLQDNLGQEESKQYSRHFEEMFNLEELTVADLNEFSIDDYGVSFKVHFGFPFVTKPIEPEGKYHFDFESLKQFIKPDSVLERFIIANTDDD